MESFTEAPRPGSGAGGQKRQASRAATIISRQPRRRFRGALL
ncbi:hypothetical protein GBAR_LOCUS25800 [Geodia barretti]|uniref:Uncharacterized protein n=1 Tax=Geodia barretti TaxID=519541 RepID=A0AA35TE42_GEOBA|nr:hypothetical protein GBAR_LOCUS25800 [Geodia barretti]